MSDDLIERLIVDRVANEIRSRGILGAGELAERIDALYANEMERLSAALTDYRWALRVTWDQLSPDEDAEIDNGPEFGMETINVRAETWTSILEWFDTDEEAERFDQTLTEALDE